MHYRLFTLILLVCLSASPLLSQKKKGTEAPKEPDTKEVLIKMYEDILNQSLAFNDLAVATQATYSLMALQPEDSARIDTLAAIYFQRGAYPQTVMVGSKVLETTPDNLEVMEMVAISKAQLGASLEALGDYEKLFGKSSDLYHLYEIASLQYTVRRYGECETSIKRLMGSEGINEREVNLSFKQGSQKVPMNAAVENLYGVLMLEQGKGDEAKKHFETALKIFPEFYLAKGNLDAMNQAGK